MLSTKHITCPGLAHVQPYGATPAVAQDYPAPPSILLPPQQQALPLSLAQVWSDAAPPPTCLERKAVLIKLCSHYLCTCLYQRGHNPNATTLFCLCIHADPALILESRSANFSPADDHLSQVRGAFFLSHLLNETIHA